MVVLKVLVMGLPASGKTTFIRHVFEEKEFRDIGEYTPTFGVSIALYPYKSSVEVKVSAFDCGGQTSFIDTYFTDQWVPRLFGEASLMLFLVDSSSRENLEDAGKLFRKYYVNLRSNSPDAEIYVMATKWDKHVISEAELQKIFKETRVYPISVLNGSARTAMQEIIENFIRKKVKPVPASLIEGVLNEIRDYIPIDQVLQLHPKIVRVGSSYAWLSGRLSEEEEKELLSKIKKVLSRLFGESLYDSIVDDVNKQLSQVKKE
jgi:GTPase SAR1 family protein